MPRCQRTLRQLTLPAKEGSVTCPFCEEGERYRRVADTDLIQYSQRAFAALVRDFGKPADAAAPVRLWHGLTPECVRCAGNDGYDIYLGTDADTWQLRLQIGHEMFHRVCSQGRVFHWSHEALACVFSVRLLRECGFGAYADARESAYRLQAEHLSVTGFLAADVALPPYPAGLYGRAFVTGDALLQTAGWPALCRLVTLNCHGQPFCPDVACWRDTLPSAVASNVSQILPISTDFSERSCR